MGSEMRLSRAVHATAIAIEGRALLIFGASRSGKSSLATALLARSRRGCRVELVGDDRVLLSSDRLGRVIVRPHARIAGFIEQRGFGIVAMAYRDRAPLAGVVRLGGATVAGPGLDGCPALALPTASVSDRADLVLAWWAGLGRREGNTRKRNAVDLGDDRETLQLVS
jgi:hypothetical protein